MEVKAKVKFVKMSARKVRLVADVIRGMKVPAALDQLRFVNKRAAEPLVKLLNSAIANAVNNFELDKNNLIIKEVKADGGPTADRWMPRARGRATPIRKRTSHINITLAEIVESGKKEARKQKLEAPVKLSSQPKEDEGIKIAAKDKMTNKDKDEAAGEEEKGKKIIDPRGEGHGKHTKIEGGSSKGFANKIFRRKSG